MLHRQTTVQPLVPGGQGGGAPPVNAPPAQANVPASQPQPGVSKTICSSKCGHIISFFPQQSSLLSRKWMRCHMTLHKCSWIYCLIVIRLSVFRLVNKTIKVVVIYCASDYSFCSNMWMFKSRKCNLPCKQRLSCELNVSLSPAWNARQRSPSNDAASKYGSCPRINACTRTGPGASTSGATR